MVSLTFPRTKRCGSGKFGMPLERMHWEKASSPFCVGVVVAAVVDVATFATRGEAPPPHPAASSENAATTRTELRRSGRRQRIMFSSFQSRAENATSLVPPVVLVVDALITHRHQAARGWEAEGTACRRSTRPRTPAHSRR